MSFGKITFFLIEFNFNVIQENTILISILRIFLFIIFWISLDTHASLILQTNTSSHLQISASNCSALNEQKEFFCEFKERIDQIFVDRNTLRCSSQKNYFTMNMSSCLPLFIKDVQNKKLFKNGANCWGTALYFQGMSVKPKFVWPEEIQYWLESPICKKIGDQEKIMPNDILNVFGPEKLDLVERELRDEGTFFWDALYPKRWTKAIVDNGSGYTGFHRLLHSVVFISENVVFGKDSPSKFDKFIFQNIQEVYGRTEDVDCQENQKLEPHIREYQKEARRIKNTKCDYFTNVYRCQNFREYFEKVQLTEGEKDILSLVQQLDNLLNNLFFSQIIPQFTLSSSEKESLLMIANASSIEALDLLKTNLNKNKEMLLVEQYFFAQSITKALENL